MKITNDVIISSTLKGQKIFKINFLLASLCRCNKNVSHSEKKYCYNFPLTTKTGKRSYCCGNITLSPEICILVTYWKEHIHSFWIFISFCRSFKRDFLYSFIPHLTLIRFVWKKFPFTSANIIPFLFALIWRLMIFFIKIKYVKFLLHPVPFTMYFCII